MPESPLKLPGSRADQSETTCADGADSDLLAVAHATVKWHAIAHGARLPVT